MFKATEEFVFMDRVVKAGDEVQSPTSRMKELGLVVEVVETKAAPRPTPKPAPKPAPKEEILTEVSSQVEISVEDPDVVKDVKSSIMEDGVVDEREKRILNKMRRK